MEFKPAAVPRQPNASKVASMKGAKEILAVSKKKKQNLKK